MGLFFKGLRKDTPDSLIAQKTIFGWIVSGPTVGTSCARRVTTVYHSTSVENIHIDLQRFWDLEEVPRATTMTLAEQQCEQHFLETHRRLPNGRYMIRLPFKGGSPISIGEPISSASSCLRRIERRLAGDHELYNAYKLFLDEYKQLGHMRLLSNDDSLDKATTSVYIPHHPVIKEGSTITRVRVVFNASCPTLNGMSLNH